MNATVNRLGAILGLLMLTASVGTFLGSCAQQETPAAITPKIIIKIDGSSTVFPISKVLAEKFQKEKANGVVVEVNFSGTTGGFKKFCAGETDISNASRPILAKEMQACKQAGVPYIELPVAFDALTVAVNPQNNWANEITLAELKKMWEPAAEGKITRWNQIRASWPNRPINLYGAGKDSGTFDYFTEAVVGEPDASRQDYTASEDDDFLVKGVSEDANALGYFGFAYYEANKDKLKALAIDSGKGPILPSRETVEKNQYQPLARPLFIYVNAKTAQTKPELISFVEFYLKNAAQAATSVGYIPLPNEAYRIALMHFYEGKVGTVFEGKAQLNLTLKELLRKQETY